MTAAAPPDAQTIRDHVDRGWWSDRALADVIRQHAASNPHGPAIIGDEGTLTWQAYDEQSTWLSAALVAAGLERAERVAVLLPDGPDVHVAFLAAEKAGLVTVGIGPRAARREVAYLVGKTGAAALLTRAEHRGTDMTALATELRDETEALRLHVVVDEGLTGVRVDGAEWPLPNLEAALSATTGRGLGPDELFMLNSTSGTTGMPKCVMHTQNRWYYFHQLAAEAGEFTPDDVFMSVIPAPFGFGLWTAHFTPALLGAPVVVAERFSADATVRAIEDHGVTVLSAVSTQFIMMLDSPEMATRDVSSLKALFTGGEAVPYDRAARFEEVTGAAVLQFYGSNETGALSRTTSKDTRDHRLRTAGRVIDDMQVRLLDENRVDVTASGGPGQPACRGPATCLGYWDDPAANDELLTEDGWMLTGDIATIDEDGYLRVVGRTSDFIIRGGKNVSAPAVEEEVLTHPAVRMAAAVAMPDLVFGERVCVYVVTGDESLTLDDLCAHLAERQVSKEMWPERLEVVDDLPRSSGGKVAKGELRDDIRRRIAEEA